MTDTPVTPTPAPVTPVVTPSATPVAPTAPVAASPAPVATSTHKPKMGALASLVASVKANPKTAALVVVAILILLYVVL